MILRNWMVNSKCTEHVSVGCRDQYQVTNIDTSGVDIVWVEARNRSEAHIR